MKLFAIAGYDDDGNFKGYYDGAAEISNKNLESASLIDSMGYARTALGNLQRGNPTLDLRIIPVEKTVTLISDLATTS